MVIDTTVHELQDHAMEPFFEVLTRLGFKTNSIRFRSVCGRKIVCSEDMLCIEAVRKH